MGGKKEMKGEKRGKRREGRKRRCALFRVGCALLTRLAILDIV
jgi:hypothetical protein